MHLFGISVCFLGCFIAVLSEVTTVSPATTTFNPKTDCPRYNESCETCLKNVECLWCSTAAERCVAYPAKDLIPRGDVCKDLGDARWGVCWLNYKALIITMGVIAGVILLTISCCCVYCCCCRKNKKAAKRYAAEDAKYEREREERETKHAERKAERQSKYDDIRKKYGLKKDPETEGLMKDDNYKRFENEPEA